MSVTDEDRERAESLLITLGHRGTLGPAIGLLATALADEREKALAPVLALADKWDHAGLVPMGRYADQGGPARRWAAVMSPSYCPKCLDVWHLEPARVQRGDWVNIWPGVRMHVVCGRALVEIEKQPRIEEDAA